MRYDRAATPSRRTFIGLGAAGLTGCLVAPWPRDLSAQDRTQERPPALDPELAHEFVSVAHSDLDATRALYDRYPRLIYATWDWGGGDWETGLAGAAHMGRRDIAAFLLDRGARLDIFCAAMMGMRTVVEGVLHTFPDAINWYGPHGFSLIRHAKAGGPDNDALVAYLELRAAERPGTTTWPATAGVDRDPFG